MLKLRGIESDHCADRRLCVWLAGLLAGLGCLAATAVQAAGPADWPQWRGPGGDNHAPTGAAAPVAWGDGSAVAWQTALPGRGHSSPVLVKDKVFLTTANESGETQSLLVLDRSTGTLLRESVAHRGGLPRRIHPNNSHASPTVASDGQSVFALFCNRDAAWVTAFDLEGEQLWQQRAIGFDPQQYQFGFGSSPVCTGGLVVVASESDGPESGVVALDAATGARRWITERPRQLTYSSPALLRRKAGVQLLLSGNYKLAAYNAATGKELWSTPGSTQATCGTMVWDEQAGLAYASGGYPDAFVLAVGLDGDHAIRWQKNGIKCYEQSLLATGGYVYGVADSGVAYCWRGSDGKEMWKARLGRGRGGYSASPLLVGDRIYVTGEGATTHVFAASPDAFRRLATNQLGDEAFATLTPGDGRLYYRYARRENGRRQEYLAAIGE
ncbi:MAG: PQQ-binding-like beta-propeller repeat protein [Planctomycetota bacterium]